MRGGSIMDESTSFYIVLFIAVLNVIAFVTVKDWKSIIFLVLASIAAYVIKPDETFCLVVGIIASNLYRATSTLQGSMQEGMKNKKKKEPDILSSLHSADLGSLMQQQKELMKSIANMGPLMQSAKEAMAHIPKDFLRKAMKKVNFK
jgi:hypothetical protein